VAFAYPSAVRVFKNEIKFINQKHEAITFSIEETRAEYKEVKADIKRYERYRDEEEPSGKLGKFNKYEDEVKRSAVRRCFEYCRRALA
jgi:hypothetical protein